MSAESVVLAGRVFEEQQMSSTCVIRRAGAPVLNEETGLYDNEATTVYTGPCQLQFVSAVVREVDAAGQAGVEQEPVLKLPVVGSEAVRVNDVAEITAHPLDAAMVGVRLRVAGIHGGAVTARRFPCEVTNG